MIFPEIDLKVPTGRTVAGATDCPVCLAGIEARATVPTPELRKIAAAKQSCRRTGLSRMVISKCLPPVCPGSSRERNPPSTAGQTANPGQGLDVKRGGE